jgi:3-methyladenine DNA glycosylase AlkD
MPTLTSVMAALKSKATAQTRNTYIRHGAPSDHTLGVSTADIKLIAKTIKQQQALACELYDTGIFEAMYLAGMVANGAQLTKKQLNSWADAAAHRPLISEHTVPWVAVENPLARQLALDWIQSKKEHVAIAGWRTYAGLAATLPDDALDLPEIEALLKSIPARIATAPNRLRYIMNSFVITVGTHVAPLLKQATAIAKQISPVAVDVGDTACKVPLATDYLAKIKPGTATKRKTIRC